MKKPPHTPIDNMPFDSPPAPASVRPPRPSTPEISQARAPTASDARIYAAVATLNKDTGGAPVNAESIAKHLGAPSDDVLDALERLVGRKLLKLIGGAPVRVQVA